MKSWIEPGLGSRQIVFRLGKKDTLNTFDAVRFVERPHSSLLPYAYRLEKGRYTVSYQVDDAYVTLAAFAARIDRLDALCELLRAFCAFFENAEHDDIFLKSVLFDAGQIFVDVRSCVQLKFIYLPAVGASGGLFEAYRLMSDLPAMTSLPPDTHRGAFLELYRKFFSVPETFSAVRFRKTVEELSRLAGCSLDNEQSESLHVSEPLSSKVSQSLRFARSQQLSQCEIVRLRTGEKWSINGSFASVGSAPGNEVQLADNSAVSRYHATIQEQDGIWYIRDEGSTNGTYTNGRALAPRQWEALGEKSALMVADEALFFSIGPAD